jgi:hypothetical protein
MKAQTEYTERIHAARLLAMLRHTPPDNVCYRCPAALRFSPGGVLPLQKWPNNPCEICLGFIQGTSKEGIHCPCLLYGSAEAIRRTKSALNYYYRRKVI